MDDTSPEIKQKISEMMQAKSPIERLKMGCSMYESAKAIVISGIKHENPDIMPGELRQQIFLRFYGNEFEPEQREKILKYLETR